MYRRFLATCAAAVALGGASAGAMEVYSADGVTVDLGATIGAGFFHVRNPGFGSAAYDRNRYTWGEGYVAPSGRVDFDTGFGTVYGGARGVFVATRGDGDAADLTPGNPSSADLDHLYAGWRSGMMFPGLGEDAIDISGGRQDFAIGDGFVIADGRFEGGTKAGYWLAPRSGWKNSAILRVNTQPVRGDLFYLRAYNDPFGVGTDNQMLGLNVEYTPWEDFTAAFMTLNIFESENAQRDGMWVHSIRAQGAAVPTMPDLFLAGEFVYQHNDDFNSWAGYVEAAYTLSQMPWSPKAGYRFSHFEADYDPLHYGMMRSWGAWFQGEITGQYVLFNQNLNIHHLQLSAMPTDFMAASLLYYSYHFDESPVASSHYGQEINLIVDVFPTDWLLVSGVYGMSWSAAGGRQFFGSDNKSHVFQVVTTLTF